MWTTFFTRPLRKLGRCSQTKNGHEINLICAVL
jgi:hypothetical protein